LINKFTSPVQDNFFNRKVLDVFHECHQRLEFLKGVSLRFEEPNEFEGRELMVNTCQKIAEA
jgi:hypothetical protein